jgi:hypothetical protein
LRKSAYIGVTVLLLLSLAAQNAYCLDVSISGNGGSVKKSIQAGIDNQYNSLTVQGDGFTLDDWSLSGSDDKYLKNKVSTGSNAQEVIVANSGNANIQGSSATDSSMIVSTLNGQADGNSNLLVSSESDKNRMIVAATGDKIDTNLGMASGQSASIVGSVSLNNEECLDEETSSYVSTGALGFSANGLRMASDGSLEDFGLVAVNQEKNVIENEYTVGANIYSNYNDPNAWVPLLYNSGYDKTGAIWPTVSTGFNSIQLNFNPSGMPKGLSATESRNAILDAANKWDEASLNSPNLFKDAIIDSSATAGKRDTKNVHQWKRLSDRNSIAMATTWFSTGTITQDKNGVNYFTISESDVSYNTAFSWTNDAANLGLYRVSVPFTDGTATSTGSKILVQSAALHELGHTLGLGDTYLHPTFKYDLSQIMTFYTDPQQDLGSGDKAGITAFYG